MGIKIDTAYDYFEEIHEIDCEIGVDWAEKNDPNLIPKERYDLVEKIIACEVAIYHMRRNIVDGSLIDSMVSMRRDLINEHDSKYVEYEENNDFY